MSDPLVRAFQENRTPAPGCASPEEIWRAVAGLEGQARTATLVDHTIHCGDCARLWRLAREAQAESAPVAVVTPIRAASRWRWGVVAGAGLAVAASALLVLRQPAVENPERGTPEARIASTTPRELPRDAFLLRWAPQGEAARYGVQVTLPDLTELDSAVELTAPEHSVPAAALARVPAGSDVLWRVEARLADGRMRTSPPFRTRVR